MYAGKADKIILNSGIIKKIESVLLPASGDEVTYIQITDKKGVHCNLSLLPSCQISFLTEDLVKITYDQSDCICVFKIIKNFTRKIK